jgi:hypothetical protein
MTIKVLYWTPRIIAILAILLMMMFSIDCFGEYGSIDDQLICFLMHNLPSFAFIASLAIAWKWEIIGGILFILFFIAAGILFGSFTGNFASLIIIGPLLICGMLFILHDYLKNKIPPESTV